MFLMTYHKKIVCDDCLFERAAVLFEPYFIQGIVDKQIFGIRELFRLLTRNQDRRVGAVVVGRRLKECVVHRKRVWVWEQTKKIISCHRDLKAF